MKRRNFIRTTAIAGLAVPIAFQMRSHAHNHMPDRKMTKNLVCGAIGIQADQRRAIELAGKYGFESVEAHAAHLAELSDDALDELKAELKRRNLVWGTAGLPTNFKSDEESFKTGLKELPKIAEGLKRAGVERVNTWLRPCHDTLTYNDNFKEHTKRLRKICKVLANYDLRFGMEYVGTTTLLTSRKYPFIHTMAETLELVDAIGTGNAGIVLDSWHWWQAGDTVEDIQNLRNKDIVLVDLNDAPNGVEKQQQLDGKRELPMATGVIDTDSFMTALNQIGYDGPVRAEPFNQPLRDMNDDDACKATIESLRKAFRIIS